MKNKNLSFTLTEIFVVFGLIVLTAILVIPNLVEENKKIDIIAKWKMAYQNIEYAFSAIETQVSEADILAFEKANSDEEKTELLYDVFKPYFRLNDTEIPKNYKVSYLNGREVGKTDAIYIDNLHYTDSGKIVGLRWLNSPKRDKEAVPVAMLSLDLNGEKSPNKWGYDIFGVLIYIDRIEPMGKQGDEFLAKSDCAKKGTGISCSYYYYEFGGRLK